MGKLKYFALRVATGRHAETLFGLAFWVGILATLTALYLWASVPLALATLGAIWLGALYWRAVTESNNLTYFIGYLLLLDDTRAIHKQSFEDWLRQSDAKDPSTLSTGAMQAIRQLADRLAAGDTKKPATSSVLGFSALIWNRKLGRA